MKHAMYDMDKPWHYYAKWKMSVTKAKYCMSPSMRSVQKWQTQRDRKQYYQFPTAGGGNGEGLSVRGPKLCF